MYDHNMYELNICYLYPDLLNLYGDRGNVMALKKRAEWRGMTVNICNVSLGDDFLPEQYDIVFLGGGQDYEQEIIQEDVLVKKGSAIKSAIDGGTVFLCICGGYQLLGKYYKTWDGREIECLGAIDIWTVGGSKRMIGNMVFECDFLKSDHFSGTVVGFENHSGRTYLGPGVKPLGKVLKGFGNNGEDGGEGAVYKNVYCSYSHGCLLPKNPALADHLLTLALKRKYPDFKTLTPLNDEFEKLAHDSMVSMLLRK